MCFKLEVGVLGVGASGVGPSALGFRLGCGYGGLRNVLHLQ